MRFCIPCRYLLRDCIRPARAFSVLHIHSREHHWCGMQADNSSHLYRWRAHVWTRRQGLVLVNCRYCKRKRREHRHRNHAVWRRKECKCGAIHAARDPDLQGQIWHAPNGDCGESFTIPDPKYQSVYLNEFVLQVTVMTDRAKTFLSCIPKFDGIDNLKLVHKYCMWHMLQYVPNLHAWSFRVHLLICSVCVDIACSGTWCLWKTRITQEFPTSPFSRSWQWAVCVTIDIAYCTISLSICNGWFQWLWVCARSTRLPNRRWRNWLPGFTLWTHPGLTSLTNRC